MTRREYLFGWLLGLAVVCSVFIGAREAYKTTSDRQRQIAETEKTVYVEWVRVHPGAIHYKLETGPVVLVRFDQPENSRIQWYRCELGEKLRITYYKVNARRIYRIHTPAPYPLTEKDPE